MKKIFLLFCAAAVLTGCATVQESFLGYSEKKYQAKVEEYKKEIPAGYSFAVEKEPPYKLKKYYFRIEQVLDKDSVIACYAYSWAYSYNQYRRGMELIGELKEKMHTNRVQRLVDIGIDEDLAVDISKRHTPNFM